jgi:NTP-dependent ternary system trypsin peptidase co-occuring protein
MARIVSMPLQGGELQVEVRDADDDGYGRAARGEKLAGTAQATLEHALGRVGPLARAIHDAVRRIDVTPQEVEVTFGLKLTAEANVILSSTAAEANFEFKLKWTLGEVAKGHPAA